MKKLYVYRELWRIVSLIIIVCVARYGECSSPVHETDTPVFINGADDGLVFWNRLGSDADIETSSVGPGGIKQTGTFVQGVFGDALAVTAQHVSGVVFPPSIVPQSAGCIEFWAKANVNSPVLPPDACIQFLKFENADGSHAYPLLHFNPNDGAANGGLCARVFNFGSIGTGLFGYWTYENALKGGTIVEWHHYALVWSVDTIPGHTSPVRHLLVYVDGTLNTGYWGSAAATPAPISYPENGRFAFPYLMNNGASSITIDNIKIWNYAKTNFSDRFVEGEVSTYDVLISKGCVNGVTAGSFPASSALTVSTDTPPTGWHFANWTVTPPDADLGASFDAFQPETAITMPPQTISLTAVWAPDTYTVSFDANGGEADPASKTVTFDAAYGELPVPSAPFAARVQWLFGGWATAAGRPVTAASVVAVAADHTLHALWNEPTPLPDPEKSPAFADPASYDGYLYRERDFDGRKATAVEGTLALNVSSATGRLNAKAATRGGPLKFRAAAWDACEGEDGTQRATMALPGGETLALSLRGNRAWGTLSGGVLDGELRVECVRNRFDAEAQTTLAGFKGAYTAALQPKETLVRDATGAAPQGAGYLSFTLSTNGKVKFAGVLADGTRVSMASQALLVDGCAGWVCVPLFFTPLYGSTGWAGGLVWLDPETGAAVTDRELGWLVRWERARGDTEDFSALLDLCGGFYAKPPMLAPGYRFSADVGQVPYHYVGGTALFAEQALPLGIAVAGSGTRMTLDRGRAPTCGADGYDYNGENCARTTLSFSPANGLYKGTFNLYYDYLFGGRLRHKTVTVKYAGVLCPVRGKAFDGAPAGMGHCLVPYNTAGPVRRSFMTVLDEEPGLPQ